MFSICLLCNPKRADKFAESGIDVCEVKTLLSSSVLDSVPNGVLEKLRALTEYIHAPNNKASLLFYCFDTLTFYLILAGALATCTGYLCTYVCKETLFKEVFKS